MPKFNLSDAKGVIPALITPFDEDEKFDESRMRNCIDFLIERGVGALYTTGSTGETFLMSPDERALVVEVVVDQVAGRISSDSSCGCNWDPSVGRPSPKGAGRWCRCDILCASFLLAFYT